MNWDNWRLLIIISLAGFTGLLFGQMMTFMFLAALGYVLWLQYNWYRLSRWLQKPKKRRPPSAKGVVDKVCRQIEQIHQYNKSRRKTLAGYLKRFQSATAALPDGIVVLSQAGEVEWANKAAHQLLGIRWPRDTGVRVLNLLRDPVFQVLLESSTKRDDENRVIKSPPDNELQLEVKLINCADSGRLLIACDVTQNIKLQRMRRDFVANVSHELKTPLTVLLGYLDAFSEDSDSDQWKMALPAMREQSERMHLLIKDLLVLSQLETGEKAMRCIPTNVVQLLKSVIDDARLLQQYQGHQLTLHANCDKWLICDSDELRSAISNLVFNAVKYTPAGCEIDIVWQEDEKGPYLEVADKGEGIAGHHLERLTERFYRVEKSRSQGKSSGTGLGLAIVKHVLQRHNGSLEIRSELDVGSRFICRFPSSLLVEEVVV